MRTWFFAHYSDPLILPYESAEGGYQWIWGGPFEPHEELTEEFSGVVKETAFLEITQKIGLCFTVQPSVSEITKAIT